MTDHDDELASAYLDGQATEEEVARVESDPALLALVEAMRSMSRRLADEPEPVDSVIRRRHLSTALAAFDELPRPEPVPGADPATEPTTVSTPEPFPGAGPTTVSTPEPVPGAGPTTDPTTVSTPEPVPGAGPTTDPITVSTPEPIPATDPNAIGGRDPVAQASPDAEVIELVGSRDARRRRAAGRTDHSAGPGRTGAAGGRRRPARRVAPAWLGAAAAVVVIGGGVWFAANQSSSGGEDTAAVATEADTTTEAAADEVQADAAREGGPGADEAELAEESALVGGGEADGDFEATTAAASEDASGGEELTAPAPSTTAPGPTTSTRAGTATSVVGFDEIPSEDDLLALRDTVEAAPGSASSCGPGLDPPAGATLVDYVAVEVAGEPGEALFYRSSGGEIVVVLVTEGCAAYEA